MISSSIPLSSPLLCGISLNKQEIWHQWELSQCVLDFLGCLKEGEEGRSEDRRPDHHLSALVATPLLGAVGVGTGSCDAIMPNHSALSWVHEVAVVGW